MTKNLVTYPGMCARLEAALHGGVRGAIVDAALAHGFDGAIAELRRGMRSHRFATNDGVVAVNDLVARLDSRCRKEGIHALEGWDYAAQRFPDETVPVLMLDYYARAPREGDGRRELSILLDHYFLCVLGLLAVRAWDEGDPNENLSRVSELVALLQGPDGSGYRFVEDAETLLLLAIAYYNPEEQAYDHLVRRVWSLDDAHRLSLALVCASALGSHLRWGLRFMYRSDVGRMRDDNIVDYPWLLFAVATLMDAYARGNERGRVALALLDALTADPWAFASDPPPSMREFAAEHASFRSTFATHRERLLADFARLSPSHDSYSPLSFSCNFLSNAVVATVATALDAAESARPALNGLFVSAEGSESYARSLMTYSSEPHRLGSGGAPLIMYDPYHGVHSYNAAMRALSE